MKNIKLINRIFPITLAITLSACSTNYSSDNKIKSSSNDLVEESYLLEEEEDLNTDAIDSNDIYFKKGEEEVTLDDIILTNREKGIDTYNERHLVGDISAQIEDMGLDYEEEEIIDSMNIEEFMEDVLLSPCVTQKVKNHFSTSLYIEEENNIDYEKLFEVLKQNNEKLIQEDTDGEIELFSDEELHIWIDQLKEFMDLLLKDNPNFDMKRFACILNDYHVYYTRDTSKGDELLAITTEEEMRYPIYQSYYPDMQKFNGTNFHEFKHLVSNGCRHEVDQHYELNCMGIFMSWSILADEEIRSRHPYIGFDSYFPFNYVFLEEAEAESYSSFLTNSEVECYLDKIFVTDNLKLSLSLQENYDPKAFLKAATSHNFIALLQQFPVLDMGRYDMEEKWFTKQLEMLECYNILNDFYSFCIFTLNKDEDTIKEEIVVLENYADLQMTRNFVYNLINSKDTTKPNITVEDAYYLMKLYQMRLEVQRKGICNKMGMESLDTDQYLEMQEEIMSYFFREFKGSSVWNYEKYNLDDSFLSEAFSYSEKEYYNNLLLKIEEYEESLQEAPITKKEFYKKYYILK